MGAPALRLPLPEGGTVWYYPRNPQGLATYAVRLAVDGTVRSVEQVLTADNARKIFPEKSNTVDVLQLLGPSWRTTRQGSAPREVWQYRMYDDTRTECNFYVWFSDSGLVEKTLLIKDFSVEPGGRSK